MKRIFKFYTLQSVGYIYHFVQSLNNIHIQRHSLQLGTGYAYTCDRP